MPKLTIEKHPKTSSPTTIYEGGSGHQKCISNRQFHLQIGGEVLWAIYGNQHHTSKYRWNKRRKGESTKGARLGSEAICSSCCKLAIGNVIGITYYNIHYDTIPNSYIKVHHHWKAVNLILSSVKWTWYVSPQTPQNRRRRAASPPQHLRRTYHHPKLVLNLLAFP